MVQAIKKMLYESPEHLVSFLEWYGFDHIRIGSREIRFARDAAGGQNISIRLQNNEQLYVKDFARDIGCDLIAYVMQTKGETFRNVLQVMKSILNLDSSWKPKAKRQVFGGIYSNLSHKKSKEITTYSTDILNDYMHVGCDRFLKDGISLTSQAKFRICFDPIDDCILIPIYSPVGDLMGLKARINHDPNENESKYYYKIGCEMSQTLFGFSENYQHLCENDVLVFESEKSVMAADSFGYHNCVALGSNSLSETQAQLILNLHPRRIIFMLDCGLDLEITKRNAETIHKIAKMRSCDIWYWDWTVSLEAGDKDSPTDNGYGSFVNIVKEEIYPLEQRSRKWNI